MLSPLDGGGGATRNPILWAFTCISTWKEWKSTPWLNFSESSTNCLNWKWVRWVAQLYLSQLFHMPYMPGHGRCHGLPRSVELSMYCSAELFHTFSPDCFYVSITPPSGRLIPTIPCSGPFFIQDHGSWDLLCKLKRDKDPDSPCEANFQSGQPDAYKHVEINIRCLLLLKKKPNNTKTTTTKKTKKKKGHASLTLFDACA